MHKQPRKQWERPKRKFKIPKEVREKKKESMNGGSFGWSSRQKLISRPVARGSLGKREYIRGKS